MFITLEGPEGAGKTTVTAYLKEHLEVLGYQVCVTREPGSGPLGQAIRQLLLGHHEIDSRTELLLFLADRAQHVATVIRPALAQGKIVLCDRYTDSTLAYQGYARGFDLETLRQWNNFATGQLNPDLTLLLDIDPKIGLQREIKMDRLDLESLEFHEKVRQGFLKESQREPQRWKIIDASLPLEEVQQQALQAILLRLQTPSQRKNVMKI
jgi:dTMP kinase